MKIAVERSLGCFCYVWTHVGHYLFFLASPCIQGYYPYIMYYYSEMYSKCYYMFVLNWPDVIFNELTRNMTELSDITEFRKCNLIYPNDIFLNEALSRWQRYLWSSCHCKIHKVLPLYYKYIYITSPVMHFSPFCMVLLYAPPHFCFKGSLNISTFWIAYWLLLWMPLQDVLHCRFLVESHFHW